MLVISMLMAVITGVFSATVVILLGFGPVWALLAYSVSGAVGLVLASCVIAAAHTALVRPTT
ncbi:hypothetical protein [Roseinatronobacter sp. NSM]|uniref:hypothetical protein n=1 Tax=Roseinatronobacter sp. NSM TaxID=3457785 RepID=UPI004036423F